MSRFAAALLLAIALPALAAVTATVPRSNPEVAKMEDVYRRYLKAAADADMAAFKAVMSERARTRLAAVNPAILTSMTRDDLDPGSATFSRADVGERAARIVYSQDRGDHVRWQGVVFVREADGWRIDRVVAAIDPKNLSPEARKGIGHLGLEDLLAHPNMQLPAP